MKKTVEVKPCCYICQHYFIDWNLEMDYCEICMFNFGHPYRYCCKYFKLKKELKPLKDKLKKGE